MKTQMLLTIIFLSITLIGFGKQNASTSPIVPSETETEIVLEQETSLTFEDWMADDMIWDQALNSDEILDETKSSTKINADAKSNDFAYKMKADKETKIVLEDWMSDRNYWKF